MNITHYFDWELRPAIIVDRGEFSNGYYLDDDRDGWIELDTTSVLDMFQEGVQMPAEEFRMEFGVLGKDIPAAP